MLQFEMEDGGTKRVYDLITEPDERALTVKTPRVVSDVIHQSLIESPAAERVNSLPALAIPPFIRPEKSVWGYGPIVQTVTEQDTVSWILEIPHSAENKDGEKSRAVSATLKLLLWMLNFQWEQYKDSYTTEKQQLLHSQLSVERKMNGFVMSAALAPAFLSWVATLPSGTHHAAAEESMRKTYERVVGRSPVGWGYQAYIESPPFFYLQVPGNAASLAPEHFWEMKAKRQPPRFSLYGHNIDGSAQQLALVAGLARMTEDAREAGF